MFQESFNVFISVTEFIKWCFDVIAVSFHKFFLENTAIRKL